MLIFGRRLRWPQPGELGERGRQWRDGWLERLGLDAPIETSVRLPVPGRFFAGAESAVSAEHIEQCCADAVESAVAASARVQAGRFDLLGYKGLDFGDPIQWHVDPTEARRGRPDIKVVWELNRHQWLLCLAQATVLTGDPRPARHLVRVVRWWLTANPPPRGVNWSSSLELALRLIVWCWVLILLRPTGTLPLGFVAQLCRGIERHAWHIERHLSTYSSPNTHLTGEALALFYAGILFDEPRWRWRGKEILVEQCGRHISRDGVYFEQSTCYQSYTVEIYLHFLALAQRNGVEVPEVVPVRVQAALDFMLSIRRPDGLAPPIGDDDGGRLLPLVCRARGDDSGAFGVAAALFGRSDYAWASGGPTPELIWLCGEEGLLRFGELRAAPPPRSPSLVLEKGGYAIMRDHWGPDAQYLCLDIGPIGAAPGGHGHADLLSLQCCSFGEAVVTDPGTFVYGAEPELRDAFRCTRAHSTVVVNGRAQAEPRGTFGWTRLPRSTLNEWRSTPELDFVDAEHGAFGDNLVHRRRVLFVKPMFWLILDDVSGGAPLRAEVRFLIDSALQVTAEPDGWMRARGVHGLLVKSVASASMRWTVERGETSACGGWVSRTYGERREATTLSCVVSGYELVRIATVLVPLEDPAGAAPALELKLADAEVRHDAVSVTAQNGGLTVKLGEDGPRITHRQDAVSRN